MFFAWIVFMGAWWWILSIAAIIVLACLADEDSWGPAIGVFFAWLLIVTLFGTQPTVPWLIGLSFIALLKYFGAYMGAGLAWSYFKWFTKLRKFKSHYNKIKADWEKMPDNGTYNEDEHGREGVGGYSTRERTARPHWPGGFEEYWKDKKSHDKIKGASWDKDEVIFWIVFWPFSVLHFCLKDLMRFLIEDVLKGTYIALRKAVLGEATKYVD
jgi:hypothetical protein